MKMDLFCGLFEAAICAIWIWAAITGGAWFWTPGAVAFGLASAFFFGLAYREWRKEREHRKRTRKKFAQEIEAIWPGRPMTINIPPPTAYANVLGTGTLTGTLTVVGGPAPSFPAQPSGPLEELAVTGWRICRLLPIGVLASLHSAELLLSTELGAATCKYGTCEGKSPNWECHCGWYAMYERSEAHAESVRPGDHFALLKVSAVGETLLCPRGWRAERMRIDEIWVCKEDEGIVPALRERYGDAIYLEEEPTWTSESPSSASGPSLSQYMSSQAFQRLYQNALVSPYRAQPLGSPPSCQHGVSTLAMCAQCDAEKLSL